MNVSDLDASRWVPTLEGLRASGEAVRAKTWWNPFGADLLARVPDEHELLAGVSVSARVHRRMMVEQEVELAAAAANAAPAPVAPPPVDWTASEQRVVLEPIGAETRCSFCATSPGRMECGACHGTGVFIVSQSNNRTVTRPCSGCSGRRTVACGSCDGSGRTRRARTLLVTDHVEALRYLFLPPMTFGLEEELRTLLDSLTPLDAMSLELDDGPERAGYRDAARGERTFLGCSFGGALAKARAAVELLGGEGAVVKREAAAWAWPVLRLRYEILGPDRDVAAIVKPDGAYDVVAVSLDT